MRTIVIIVALAVSQSLYGQVSVNSETLPERALNVRVKSFHGGTFRLRARTDRRTVVLLWASWCPSCLEALWEMQTIRTELSQQRVRLVGLTFENSAKDRALARKRSQKVRYLLGFIDLPTLEALAGERTPVPQVLVITGDGRVLLRRKGFYKGTTITELLATLRI